MISTGSPTNDPLSNVTALDGYRKINLYKKHAIAFWVLGGRLQKLGGAII